MNEFLRTAMECLAAVALLNLFGVRPASIRLAALSVFGFCMLTGCAPDTTIRCNNGDDQYVTCECADGRIGDRRCGVRSREETACVCGRCNVDSDCLPPPWGAPDSGTAYCSFSGCRIRCTTAADCSPGQRCASGQDNGLSYPFCL